ncbi:hypothetical protein BKA66DRAFT_442147 [Pyrenochaeta sp. MPI-SDFR-AT-0127]|nr:hypothetical protein BKA66DRAFT_442147 [Pyrenochaeta sp. MPI-SDFR-AT-0127]
MAVIPQAVGKTDMFCLTNHGNGGIRPGNKTSDLLSDLVDIVACASFGNYLQESSLAVSGRLAGVAGAAMGMDTLKYLKDGDLVEVEIREPETCCNKVVFDSESVEYRYWNIRGTNGPGNKSCLADTTWTMYKCYSCPQSNCVYLRTAPSLWKSMFPLLPYTPQQSMASNETEYYRGSSTARRMPVHLIKS